MSARQDKILYFIQAFDLLEEKYLTDTLIKNGLILTMDRSRRVIEGSISIEDGDIKEVGNPREDEADSIIDAEGKIVMPGLVSAYARPYRTLLRAAPLEVESPTDFTQILQRIWWPLEEEISNEDSHVATMGSCLEFIKSGITFFAGIQSSQSSIGKSLDHVASAIEKSGLRAMIAFAASERHTRAEGARGMKENVRFLEKMKKKSPDETRVGGMSGLDLSITSSDELLRHGKRVANSFDVPIVISTAEGKVDLYHNLENYGKRTIERFRDVGLLSSNTILANCVHVNKDELSIIEKTGAKIAHNPKGNMINATGVAKIPNMKERGIPVGLGNDSCIFDGFENIRLLYMVHKAATQDPRTITPMEALETATIDGAKLYEMENQIGSIEPGKKADMIIINPSNLLTPLRRDNVANYLVESADSSDIETVMVGGDLLMKNRSVKTLNEKRIRRKSIEKSKEIWENLEIR